MASRHDAQREDGAQPPDQRRLIDGFARRAWARRFQEPELWEQRGHAYSDLVVEAHELLGASRAGAATLPGVQTETRRHDVATVVRMLIETPEAGRVLGKVPGYYSTIEAEGLRERNEDVHQKISQILAEELAIFLQRLGIGPEDPVLVVGLGNWNSTPDSLGPKTVGQLLVTRHLHQMVPPEARGGLRPLSALAPGVLGLTGIETAEIISGVVHRTHPALVVCIDALAARSTRRLATTIQMADTGIHPGSGVGNKRYGITRETLGVPVLAVGVPTVIQAATIISDGMEMLAQQPAAPSWPAPAASAAWGSPAPAAVPWPSPAPAPPGPGPATQPPARGATPAHAPGAPWSSAAPSGWSPWGSPFAETGVNLQQKQQALRQLLAPFMGDLIVTPKDIDVLVEDMAQTLAAGLNAAFHPSLDLSNVLQYLQ